VAGAISQALAMPIEERRARHQALLAAILDHDVDRWQREFLAALRGDDDVKGTFAALGAPASPRRQKPEIAYAGPSASSPPVRLNPVRKTGRRLHQHGVAKKSRYKAFDA
jgi:hypothetical protein